MTNSRVSFESNVDGATLFIDGEDLGELPTTTKLSNGIWEEPDIRISKDGYRAVRSGVKKEVKIINAIFGFIGWWPSYLYCYGPKAYQYYELIANSK